MGKAKLYGVARDEQRGIGGYDVLVADYGGLRFLHPTFIRDERPFRGKLAVCKQLADLIGSNCFCVTADGVRTP